ncbi:BTB/POZ domain-containing protein [Phthorimaea operculella]|nr:BTB/POZ domain-containing protein [Phthorimaea operculella]
MGRTAPRREENGSGQGGRRRAAAAALRPQRPAMADAPPEVLELNVGGVHYATTRVTLLREPDSLLAAAVNDSDHPRDARGRIFFDRDGVLFRYVLDYLRDGSIVLPECFREHKRLAREARHYRLAGLETAVRESDPKPPNREKGCIVVGYRGSFQFGRDGLADVKFRKLSRILVCGKVTLCRDVFGETLNESRDPDHGLADRYTSRFFLKHSFIEQAFDNLQENGFKLQGSCGSGTAGGAAELKPGVDSEENRWNHYNEFVFIRD